MNHRPRQIQVKHLLVLRRIQVEDGLIGSNRSPRHVATSRIKQGVHLAVFFYNSRAYCFDHLPVEHVAFHKLAAAPLLMNGLNNGFSYLFLTAQEEVTRIVTTALVAQHRHTMVHTHRHLRTGTFEDACQLNQVCTSSQVAGLGKVAIGKDMARAHVYKVGARRIFTSQLYQIVVTTGRLSTTLQRMP